MDRDKVWQQIKEAGSLAGRPVTILQSTDSTNTYAVNLARQGAECGSVVVAETQAQGRGRLGREWQSPSGSGLYFSMVWHSRLVPAELARITLAAGLGLCIALEKSTGLPVKIKWPNDLLLDGRKVGGILTENNGKQGEHSLVVVGIGLNVNTPPDAFSEELREKASSLQIFSGKEYLRGKLLAVILAELDDALDTLEGGKFNEILTGWRQRDATIHKTTSWLTPDRKVVKGVSLGINDEGLLHIRDAKGCLHQVLSGDVNLL